MYGGLFGDLPTAKNQSSGEGDGNEKAQDRNDDVGTKQKASNEKEGSRKKRQVTAVSRVGNAGTSMAFMPAALRNRKRPAPKKSTFKTVAAPKSVITKVPEKKNTSQQGDALDTNKTATSSEELNSAQPPSLEDDVEPEEIRQLHASVKDPYDPYVPNDLLAFRERKAAEEERLQLERAARETLERQQRLREKVERERQELQAKGNVSDIVQHRVKTAMGRGRGRGMTNLPAWVVKQQTEQLGQTPSSSVNDSDIRTVILSNLTAPGDVDDDLADDVKDECEEQCGPVENIIVKDANPPLQPEVQVWVRFEKKADADKATRLFEGRKFGQRRITAMLLLS